jgi:processing peptidase subunit beta
MSIRSRAPSMLPTRLGTSGRLGAAARRLASGQPQASRDVEKRLRLPEYLLNVPPTQVTALPNKFRVASEHKHGETATVGVWIDAGSVWETAENNGVAHFLEHLAFKGTKNRTKEQIEIEIENMGGQLNAYTSREQTVYHAHVFKKDVPKAVEIISDIIQNSNLKEADVERERSVILREMEEVESQTEEVIFDHLHSVAFQNTSLGYTILGPEKNIKNIKREDLVSYVGKHYTAPRMVLSAAGAVDHDELVKLAEKHFSGLSSDVNVDYANREKLFDFTGSMVQVRDTSIPLVHTTVAAKSVGWSDPDYFTFLVLQQLIGSWDRSLGGAKNLSSNLAETFATEELAHSLMSFNTCYHETGLFGAYFVGEMERTSDAIFEVLREWVRIGSGVSEVEVERAKNKLKSTYLMQLDGTQAVAEDIGRQLLTLGRRMPAAEAFMRIDAINAKKVRDVAYTYLNDVDVAVAAVGSVDSGLFPDYNVLRGWTYWNRL